MTETAARLDALYEESLAIEAASVGVGGAGLFVPELVLGRGHLHPDDEAAIAEHLVAVARARQVPLHPAVAWNCLYFGYDPDRPGYDAVALGPMDLPTLVGGARSEALPVGALVEYSSGTAVDHREWAEVIYKEGRAADALDADGLVRPAYSGAVEIVGLAPGDEQVAAELLVLDFEPLGPVTWRWLERAREDEGRTYIDEFGHVRIEACYADEGAAQMSDADYFCEFMLGHHHELLASGWLGAALDDPDDATIAEALGNSLDAVEDVLERSGAFAEWNGYYYLKEDYDAAADPERAGGRADARQIVTSLARVPRGEHIVYRPFSPLLREVVGHAPLRYGGYARHAVMTGALVAEVLNERAPDGILVMRGENVVLRRDDCWLFSGVWRAERRYEGTVCSLVGFPVTVTLGLGASGEAGHEDVALGADTDDEITATVEPEPEVLGDYVFWSTALRESHRVEQRMWADPRAGLSPRPDGTIVLRLAHQGDLADDERAQQVGLSADGAWLSPVRFPFDFFTGIRLNCLALPGGSMVRATTEFLPEGEEVAGCPYYYAFDRSLVDPTRPAEARPTLGRLALNALIRQGEDVGAGWRRLSGDAIAEIVFGPDIDEATVGAVGAALRAGGRAHLEGGWWYYRTSGAQKSLLAPGASGLFAGASEALSESVERAAVRHHREHRVVLHLRRLWVSEEVGPQRQAEYRYWRERAPNRANLPQSLPAGYTFVASHTRGRGGR